MTSLRTLGGDAKGGDVVGEIVGDGGVPNDRNADLRQAQAEPLAIGVEILARGQFGADRDDFRFHARTQAPTMSAAIGGGEGRR